MEKKKKMVWFWPEKHDGRVINEAEDVAAEHISIEGTMSHYSFSKGLLPPLGVGATARSSRHIKLRCFIVSPFDPRYRYEYFSLTASVFSFFCVIHIL